MTYDVPVQMNVSEGFGPIPAPASSLLVANATIQTIDNVGYLVLDKTYAEIRDASFAVIKYVQYNGNPVWWYVYSVRQTQKAVDTVTLQSNLSISMRVFTAENDNDFPKVAI